MIRNILTILMLLFSFDIAIVKAESDSGLKIAKGVAKEVLGMKKPSRESAPFERWAYDTAQLTALTCWQFLAEGNQMPKGIGDGRLMQHGVYTLPPTSHLRGICQSIATNGVHPFCTSGTIWIDNVKMDRSLPLEYLQMNRGIKPLIQGSLSCYLNAERLDKQSYSGGSPTMEILHEPQPGSFMTSSGPRTLISASAELTWVGIPGPTGSPFKETRRLIILK